MHQSANFCGTLYIIDEAAKLTLDHTFVDQSDEICSKLYMELFLFFFLYARMFNSPDALLPLHFANDKFASI